MRVKITFVKNQIDSCKTVPNPEEIKGDLIYQVHNGFLIYALIKSQNEQQAREKADELATRVLKTPSPK